MSFTDVMVLIVAWLATASTMRTPVRTKRSMLPSGVLLWTVACTLQIAPIYNWIDPLLGGQNVTNLIYRSLTIAALGCLEVMVIRATRGRGSSSEAVVAGLTVALVSLQTLLFLISSWPITDTYLAPYGGQAGRELFWNVMPLCVAAFSVHVIVAVGAEWRAHSVRATRWGLLLIGLAACIDLLWTAEGIVTSLLRISVNPSLLLGQGSDPIAATLLGTMVVCTGLGVALASAESFVEHVWMRVLLVRVTPIWHRVIKSAPELSLTGTKGLAGSIFALEVEHVLLRRWVEILDCERAKVFSPTRKHRSILDSIAATLAGTTPDNRQRSAAGLSGLLSAGR